MVIRSELRKDDQGNPEVWANLGDVLDWLETLARDPNPVGASVAREIKTKLIEAVPNWTVVQKP